MKNLILLLLILISSCKPEHIRIKEKLIGSWKLTNFQYINTNDKLVSEDKFNYIINFDNDSKGVMQINAKDFNFTYDFGYEQYDTGYADCDIDVENNNLLPIEAIGKVQVYSYKFINRNTIEFHIDKEFDFSNKQVIRNVTYTFVKN